MNDNNEITREEKIMAIAVIKMFANELETASKQKDFTKVIRSAMTMQSRVENLIAEHIGVWDNPKLVKWLSSTMSERFCQMVQKIVLGAMAAGVDPVEQLNEGVKNMEAEL